VFDLECNLDCSVELPGEAVLLSLPCKGRSSLLAQYVRCLPCSGAVPSISAEAARRETFHVAAILSVAACSVRVCDDRTRGPKPTAAR
jgi:hypothetical protein